MKQKTEDNFSSSEKFTIVLAKIEGACTCKEYQQDFKCITSRQLAGIEKYKYPVTSDCVHMHNHCYP